MRTVDNQIRSQLDEIRKLDPRAVVGYRGSLARGQKGRHKGNAPFDARDFDVDAFIVSDRLAEQFSEDTTFRDGSQIHRLNKIQTTITHNLKVDSAREEREHMKGLREGLTFRIFTREEFNNDVSREAFKIP
jgi:hypothetical protein